MNIIKRKDAKTQRRKDRKKFCFALLSLVLLCVSTSLSATPTSLFWTNCTTDVQPTGTGHIGVDNLFTVFNRRGHGQSFATDVGFLIGAYTWHDISSEIGIDYLGGTDDPIFFNGKIGMAEGKLFSDSPSWSFGIFDIGTRTRGNRTNQNVIDVVIGKSMPDSIGGTLYIGGYSGSRAIGKNRQGFMIGYSRGFCHTKDCNGKEYDEWELAADWASGNNWLGGGGVSMLYYFNHDISLQTGPVFFNTARYNGTWKWSIQIDIDIPVFKWEK